MFTGLVEEMGTVAAAGKDGAGYSLTIAARTALEGLRLGDSIAINGVCLTATAFDGESFTVGLAPETLAKTDLGDLRPGAFVNLERAALPTTRLGGHYVQGHVDGTGTIRAMRPDGDALWVEIAAPEALMRYIVPKGYIAVDGASLTVVHVGPDWFDLTLIAYSQTKLVLPRKTIGARVNLEVDILAKYVERLLRNSAASTESISPSLPTASPPLLQSGGRGRAAPRVPSRAIESPSLDESTPQALDSSRRSPPAPPQRGGEKNPQMGGKAHSAQAGGAHRTAPAEFSNGNLA